MKKTTRTLTAALKKTPAEAVEAFLKENEENLIQENLSFPDYMRNQIKKKGLTQQNVFLAADLPERYGYKLLSGQRHTSQRDIILRLCLGAKFSLEETQQALQRNGMAQLYPRVPRDVMIMIQFNLGNYDIFAVNSYLEEHGEQPLSGTEE